MTRGVEDAAWEAMQQAGVEEARRAKESGEIDAEGYPLVTVVADCAWSKRSYRHKNDAPSGTVSTTFLPLKGARILIVDIIYISLECVRKKSEACFSRHENTLVSVARLHLGGR